MSRCLKLILSPYTLFWFSILVQSGAVIALSPITRVLRMEGAVIWKISLTFTMIPTSKTWKLWKIAPRENPSTMAREGFYSWDVLL